MLFPLLDMAMRVYRENTTFEDIQIEAYEDYKNVNFNYRCQWGRQIRICGKNLL